MTDYDIKLTADVIRTFGTNNQVIDAITIDITTAN